MFKSTSLPALVIRVSGRWQGFEDGVGEWGDGPVLAWPQRVDPWAMDLLAQWIFSWAEEYSLALAVDREVQLSLLGQRIAHIHLLLQRTQVKEYGGGLYPGSDSSSSTYSSSQDQVQMQNSWRRIQPWRRSTMVSHPSNRLYSKSVGWL